MTSWVWLVDVRDSAFWLLLVVVVVAGPVMVLPVRLLASLVVAVLVAETVSDWFLVVWKEVAVEPDDEVTVVSPVMSLPVSVIVALDSSVVVWMTSCVWLAVSSVSVFWLV